jgi:hypothetical protein
MVAAVQSCFDSAVDIVAEFRMCFTDIFNMVSRLGLYISSLQGSLDGLYEVRKARQGFERGL